MSKNEFQYQFFFFFGFEFSGLFLIPKVPAVYIGSRFECIDGVSAKIV